MIGHSENFDRGLICSVPDAGVVLNECSAVQCRLACRCRADRVIMQLVPLALGQVAFRFFEVCRRSSAPLESLIGLCLCSSKPSKWLLGAGKMQILCTGRRERSLVLAALGSIGDCRECGSGSRGVLGRRMLPVCSTRVSTE